MSGSVNGGKNKNFSLQDVTGTTSSTSRPLAPEGWEDAWRSMQAELSPGGLTAPQRQGADWLSSSLRDGDAARLGGIRSALGDAAAYWKDAADNRSSNTLATLAARYPEYYKPFQDVAAGTAGARDIGAPDVIARDIAAQRGAQLMGDYQNPYMKDVVDASLADYDTGTAEARTALRAGNAGAFGNKRTGVAEGQFASDSAVGRGKLAADLRAGGFNTAAALGMQDADRRLSADRSNQSAGLQAAIANAANRLGADQFNARQNLGAQQFNNEMQNQREMFDVNAGYRGYEMRDDARRALENNLGAQAALGQQGLQMNSDLANSLIGAGGVGQSQNLAWLGAGTPLFGEQSDAAQSATTRNNGRSSSKGGEISGIPFM
ncbi:MAG: hypothetical protein AB7H70_14280 [Rhodospirillaceae bacterium]